MMDRSAYLARIGYEGALTPAIETLRGLHRAHVMTVPFENLDIHLGRPISLDPADLFRKIVVDRRGGYCFELNGLFALLGLATMLRQGQAIDIECFKLRLR